MPAIDLKFNRPQFRAFAAVRPGNSVFLGFGRGVGKSWLLRQLCWMLVAEHERKVRDNALLPFSGVRITALAPTLTQWKDIHGAGIEEELSAGGRWGHLGGKIDRNRGQVTFPNGSSLRPFPASEHNSRTARGMRTDVLLADEVDDIEASVYDGVAIPWLSEPWSLGIQLLSGTPTRGRHGLWWRSLKAGEYGQKLRDGLISPDEALSSAAGVAALEVFETLNPEHWPPQLPRDPRAAALTVLGGFYSFHATYKDAPETVSPLAVARAKAVMTPSTFAREWLADPDAGEGRVYAFDEAFHVRVPPSGIHWTEFWVGCDHGWNDPGVFVLGAITGRGNDAVVWILDEVYLTETPNHIWDAKARAWTRKYGEDMGLPPPVFACDRSRPDRIQDLVNAGVNARGAENSIEAGVSRVADLLAIRHYESDEPRARLYVHPRCTNTIREFGEYRRKKDPRDPQRFLEAIEDRNNHTMDAIRYVAVERFGLPTIGKHIASGR